MTKTVAVFFGGISPEHDISIITALAAVIKPLELAKQYEVLPIYIAKTGAWYSDETLKDVATFRSQKIDELLSRLKPVSVTFDGGLTVKKAGLRTKPINVDIAFPAMHGGNGEDGSLMGLLRLANIPFVGSDMEASVIAMDKVLAKQVAAANDIPVSKFQAVRRDDFSADADPVLNNLEKSLSYPLFVKPAHLGSSIGISRATNRDELQNSLEVAAYYDHKIIVEEAVANLIEVTVPIIGNDQLQPALAERPLTEEGKLFDFDTKYMHGGKKTGATKTAGAQGYSELPAKLPGGLYDQAIDTALAVYRAAGCEGISRIDLLIDSKAKQVYFNEINPLPGSLYAHNWRKAGLPSVELVTRLVELAEARYADQQKLERTFSTDFLKQF